MEEFKDRIRILRDNAGYSMKDVANRIGVSEGAVSLWESGRNPSNQSISSLAKLYGVRVEWLRTGEGPRFAEPPEGEKKAKEYALEFAIELLSRMPADVQAEVVEFCLDLVKGTNRISAENQEEKKAPEAGAESQNLRVG